MSSSSTTWWLSSATDAWRPASSQGLARNDHSDSPSQDMSVTRLCWWALKHHGLLTVSHRRVYAFGIDPMTQVIDLVTQELTLGFFQAEPSLNQSFEHAIKCLQMFIFCWPVTNTSSKYTIVFGMPFKSESMTRWNMPGADNTPFGSRLYVKRPRGVYNKCIFINMHLLYFLYSASIRHAGISAIEKYYYYYY